MLSWLEFTYLSKNTPYIKLEMFSIPNLDFSEKTAKVVIKQDKFKNLFSKLVALIFG